MRARERSSSAMVMLPPTRKDDRPNVVHGVFERDQHEFGYAIAGVGSRPVVEGQLKVAETADLVAVLGGSCRDASGFIIDDRNAARPLVAVEPVDVADEGASLQLQVRGDLTTEHLERRLALHRQQPIDVALHRSLCAAYLQFELDGSFEAAAIAFEGPGDVLPDARAHRRRIARFGTRKLAVKIL